MNTRRGAWWKDHFDLETLAGYGLAAKAPAEARGAAALAGLRRGGSVLDVCCGAGRHSVRLAELGYAVTGVDIRPELLEAARRACASRGVSAEFRRADMRRLPYRSRFDAALILFTSFGYFEREADDARALASVRRALRPGGRLVLDLLNKEWLMRHFTPRFRVREPRGPVARAESRLSFDLRTGRLDNRRTLVYRDGRRRRTFLSIRVYTLTEIGRLLDEAGLKLKSAHGGLGGRRYGMDAFRMVVTAEKPRKN